HMKTAIVQVLSEMRKTRMPDGTLAYDDDGEISGPILCSMLVAIPDAATSQDVERLGSGYFLALTFNTSLRIDWEEIGDTDGLEGNDDGISVVLREDDPAEADVEFAFDEQRRLVIKDESIRWQAAPWEPHVEKDDKWLDQVLDRLMGRRI